MEPQNVRRRESGQMLVLFILALGVLMGMVAMTIDVGLILHERRSQQNAADAAALAAVAELPDSPSAAVAAAYDWANRNGYSSADGATVIVNTPYLGDPSAIEVIIEENATFVFARVLELESAGVSARAVAAAQPGADYVIFVNAGGCEKDALNIQGSTANMVGDIHSNSELKVNSDLYLAGSVTHVCGANVSGANTFTQGLYIVTNERGWPVSYDYEDFPCTFTHTGGKMKIGKSASQYYVNDDPDTKTLKPGVYCSEAPIEVNANGVTGNVTFVSKSPISINCDCGFEAYWNDVLAFSDLDSDLINKVAISLSVSDFEFEGIFLAPHGEINATGSTFNSDSGSFVAETVSISASDINITAITFDEPGPPKLVE